MKKTIIFLIVLLFTTTAMAQTITGIIKDSKSVPISYATLVLCNLSDTTQVDYAITDIEGRFNINPKRTNKYLLHISCIGYKPKYVLASPNLEIILEEDALTLHEAVVKGSRPISKITTNGVQTSVANTVLSKMGTGNDVLKRIPTVSGDDGSFEVFGKGAAKIYINSREVRDPSELENLNSSDIQNIEVISNPGARYDASVKAVINIKTVRKKGDGFSFNARSSFYTWENQDYINQINTNYRKGGLDVFANVFYSNITNIQKGDISQTTRLYTLWRQQSYVDGTNTSNELNGTVGANYEINKNHYIGLRYKIRTSPSLNVDKLDLTSDVYADSEMFDHWENNETKNIQNKIGSEVNLYYTGKVEKLSIDFNADYMDSGSESNNVNTEKSQEYGDRTLHSTSNIGNRLWAGKLQLSYLERAIVCRW